MESAIGDLRIAEVKLPQRITKMFHLPIDRIEPLLQYCSCSSKTMMNCISNRVHLSITISVSTAIFQMNLVSRYFIEAKDDGGGGDNWSYKSCKAPV